MKNVHFRCHPKIFEGQEGFFEKTSRDFGELRLVEGLVASLDLEPVGKVTIAHTQIIDRGIRHDIILAYNILVVGNGGVIF